MSSWPEYSIPFVAADVRRLSIPLPRRTQNNWGLPTNGGQSGRGQPLSLPRCALAAPFIGLMPLNPATDRWEANLGVNYFGRQLRL
jgi:hypothetical protein